MNNIEMRRIEVKDGEETYVIEVRPDSDTLRPDLAFMHAGDLFEDFDGIDYEIVQAKQAVDRNESGFTPGDKSIRHVYLARRVRATGK